MKTKQILKKNGTFKAKVEITKYRDELYTTVNGQWIGQGITPKLAKLVIEVLNEYVNNYE